MKCDQFSIREPESKSKLWYEWLNYRIRHYFVLEIGFLLLLVLLLINSYHTSTQNVEALRMISSLQTDIKNIKPFDDENQQRTKEPLKDSPFEEKSHQSYTNPSVDSSSPKPSSHAKFTPNSEICDTPLFNAASYIERARLLNIQSYSSDQIVLLDRPNPPKSAEWCTEDVMFNLTIKLSNYITPVYVSYQHSRWTHTVPREAPRVYDVVGCIDEACNTWEYLVSNCLYQSKNDEQEQKCPVSSNPKHQPIKFVQFRFHGNHGDPSKTCVSLLRVVGKLEDDPEKAEKCEWFAWAYNNYPLLYNLSFKNCTVLYSAECCDECPECCEKCLISDLTYHKVIFFFASLFSVVFLFTALICWCERQCSRH